MKKSTTFPAVSSPHLLRICRQFLLLGFIAAVFAGCAHRGEMPSAQLAKAEVLLENARSADAYEYAALELNSARENFDKAEKAVTKNNFIAARRYAEKAIVDAQLAEAKANAEKAQLSLQEVNDSIRTLREETSRKSRI